MFALRKSSLTKASLLLATVGSALLTGSVTSLVAAEPATSNQFVFKPTLRELAPRG